MEQIDPQSWPIVSKLLDEWLDLPEERRTDWLASLPSEYESVLPLLRSMLQKYERAGDGFLNKPAIVAEFQRPAGEADPFPTILAEGSQVGSYRLLRRLGHGGMASVWLAEGGDAALKRKVALKIPYLMAPDGVLAERFARERDILAQLSDPRIARLYDAGVAQSGQPYLVLEHVEGVPITNYCDQQLLPLAGRLRLFLQVLRAVRSRLCYSLTWSAE